MVFSYFPDVDDVLLSGKIDIFRGGRPAAAVGEW